ncbi:MAG: phage regulatory CII family protein [Pseudomonadota bacterium]
MSVTFHKAIRRSIRRSDYENADVAQHLGVSDGTLGNMLNPNNQANKLGVEDAVKIMNFLRDSSAIDALQDELLVKSHHSDKSILELTLHAASSISHICSVTDQAMLDDVVSDNEANSIYSAIEVARERLDTLSASVLKKSKTPNLRNVK